MMKKHLNLVVHKGIALTSHRNQYNFNGVTYNVTSVFDNFYDESKTISDKVTRIVDTQFAHLMSDENSDTMGDVNTLVTAKRI